MEEQKALKENKMGVMPIGKLLVTMSVPIMLSMLVQAFYNVVDSIFVAQINENALTAVSLAFPVQNLMIAVATGTGVGVNALLSRALGAGDREYANKVANNGIMLAFFSYLVFVVFTALFADFYYQVQTSNLQIIQYGNSYIKVIGMIF